MRFYRMPRLIDKLTRATAMYSPSRFLSSLVIVDLLMLDDVGLTPRSETTQSRSRVNNYDNNLSKRDS